MQFIKIERGVIYLYEAFYNAMVNIFIKPDMYNSQSEIDIKVVSRYDSNKSVLISHSIYDNMGDLVNVFDSIYKLDPGTP